MTMEPLISQQVRSANKFLWAVKTYIDLISRDDLLVCGSGLKRLYAMASGVSTYNEADIEAIAAKSERYKLVPHTLHGFMMSSITKNIELYGKELQRVINKRVVSISSGDVRNPDPLYKFSAEEARRYFYVPAPSFIVRLQKAIATDTGMRDFKFAPPQVITIQDVANDAEFSLTRIQIEEGHMSPIETSWGALIKCVEDLVAILENESRHIGADYDYRVRARGALKILWFIAKLLLGDLTSKPANKDVNLVDLDQRLQFTDGTLAAIPFPLRETIELFSDEDSRGISMKGRFYLQAVSAAAFYRAEPDEENR